MASYRKTKNGWEAMVARKGVRKSRTFPNKAQAQQWAGELEAAILGGTHHENITEVIGLTVAELLRRYEQETGANWSEGKAASARRANEALGQILVADIDQISITRWATQGSPYAMSTSVHILKTLAGALNYAKQVWTMDTSKQPVNDALGALEASGRLTPIQHRDRRVSAEEERLLVKHWQSQHVSPDVVAFLIDTPMRSGEMVALQWDDVDGKVAVIRNRKDPKRKIGNHQRIPLLGRSLSIITARNTERPFPWTQPKVGLAIKAAAEAAELDDLRCHDLRHEGISRLFDAGWSIPQVALVSGHKNWKTLERYTHIKAEDLHDLEVRQRVAKQ